MYRGGALGRLCGEAGAWERRAGATRREDVWFVNAWALWQRSEETLLGSAA